MVNNITVKIDGLEQLGERMRLLATDVSTKIAARATNAGAQVIKKLAIKNAPEWPKDHKLQGVTVPAGNLKRKIIVKKIKSELTAQYIVTVLGKRKDFYAARYGRLLEFGTVKMKANPFLRKAFDDGKEAAKDAIIDKLEAGIIKAEK